MKSRREEAWGSRSQNPASVLRSACCLLFTCSSYLPIVIFLLSLVFLACGPKPPVIYVRPETGVSDLRKVAVLPFDNLSGEEGAGEKLTDIFTIELMRTGRFDVAEPGRVKRAVKERRIRTTRDMDLEAARWLGENLDLNLILVGSVLEFKVQEYQNKRVPVVTVILRLVQANTGTTLWATFASRKGDDRETLFGWGRITSLSQLAKEVATETVSALQVK